MRDCRNIIDFRVVTSLRFIHLTALRAAGLFVTSPTICVPYPHTYAARTSPIHIEIWGHNDQHARRDSHVCHDRAGEPAGIYFESHMFSDWTAHPFDSNDGSAPTLQMTSPRHA
jgi:hypothetical protein